ncbi:Crp/Fnr family transcriptional regulator [uncultured Roseobacter sp.]|uniref:Crp/Fnr family transcriptional regulator n=1 Tax=uncultured Roseobacter sp. TaxID=114847 RepID=UPI0026237081|nr:Crp/Fnr family transcriptional regulator [uncultured Roseobacter sp.]
MGTMFEIAGRAAIFSRVPADDIEKLLQRSSLRSFDRGASIYLQGERAHSLYVVLEGWVKTYRITPCGNEAVIGIFTKCNSFGDEAALGDGNFISGAEAVSTALILQIDAHVLAQQLADDMVLCRSVLSGAMESNRCLVHHVEQLKSHTAGQRIADFLLSLCDGKAGSCTVILPYDKVLIAAWLGMKPESLSRAFRRLKDYGVTIQKDHAIIASVEHLAQYADEDPAESWSAKHERKAERCSSSH